MEYLTAIFLGLVQGLTEFLPVSSSGHLILAHNFFESGVTTGDLAFDAVLHFATALAVVVYFWRDLLRLAAAVFRLHDRTDPVVRELWAIVAATIPAVILGLLLEDIMATLFRNPLLVGVTLVLGTIVMFFAEKLRVGSNSMTVGKGFVIGLFQSLALVPGMSRSGMAISGGLYLGLSREAAARFAFLLAVPLLLGAGAKKILDLSTSGSGMPTAVLLLGAVAAFAVGIVVIHYLLKFVRTHSLMVFMWYRLFIAVIILGMYVI